MEKSPVEIGWAVVELMGHRRLGAYVTEVEIAGAGMLRAEVPATGRTAACTQFVAPTALYAIDADDGSKSRAPWPRAASRSRCSAGNCLQRRRMRRSRTRSYEEDLRKIGAALELGWLVVRSTPDLVQSGEAVRWVVAAVRYVEPTWRR